MSRISGAGLRFGAASNEPERMWQPTLQVLPQQPDAKAMRLGRKQQAQPMSVSQLRFGS